MTSVDDLSCEMLANPGLITFDYSGKRRCREHGHHLARLHNCKFIEFGWGIYKLIKVKKMKNYLVLGLKIGKVIRLKRKPTSENNATEVFRTIKEIDYKKKTVSCDDNIIYKFKNIIE
jgi:hypothetical protein